MATLEPGAITKFRIWRQEELKDIETKKQGLATLLLNSAPKSLENFLDEVGLISVLLNDGHSEYKFDKDDTESLECRDLKDLFQRLTDLERAWTGVVKISRDWMRDGRLAVVFTAI